MLTKEEKIQYVTQAIELISDPERWCKGSNAKDACGIRTGITSENACKWCGEGALIKFGGSKLQDEINNFCQLKYSVLIAGINDCDCYGREKVIEVFQQYLESL